MRKLLRSAIWSRLVCCITVVQLLTSLDGYGQIQELGVPWIGQRGVTETVAESMVRAKLADSEPGEPRETEPYKLRPNRWIIPMNPNSRDLTQWPPNQNAPPVLTSPMGPQTLGTSFTGATRSGTNPTSAFPPDCQGAVGPTQYVVMVNNRIVTFNKSTGLADGVINTTTNTFFNSVRNASGTSDPRVRYDRLSSRWFLVIINVSTPNRILI